MEIHENRTIVEPLTISEDEFFDRFKPIGPEEGPIDTIMDGVEVEYVWSCFDGCDGQQYIISGKSWVHCYGYWICAVPVGKGEQFLVIPDTWDEE